MFQKKLIFVRVLFLILLYSASVKTTVSQLHDDTNLQIMDVLVSHAPTYPFSTLNKLTWFNYFTNCFVRFTKINRNNTNLRGYVVHSDVDYYSILRAYNRSVPRCDDFSSSQTTITFSVKFSQHSDPYLQINIPLPQLFYSKHFVSFSDKFYRC
jgi:hypothetical protein